MKRKKILKIIMLLSVIAIASCSKATDKTGDGNNKYTPAGLKENQAIINAWDKMEWVFGKNYQKWTPFETDIENAEKLINQCFNDQKRGTVNRLLNRKPEDYLMQFVGAINENGEKIIWVNCLCKKEIDVFKDWKTNIRIVSDGGNCFFNVKINVNKNTYYDLMVNGNA
jgi:hypothetical protein